MDRERFRKPSAHNAGYRQTDQRPRPTLLDDDDDIFALWQSQKQLQIQRLAEETAKRELKRARKQLAKEERRRGRSTAEQSAGREIAISLALPAISVPSVKDLRNSTVLRWALQHRKGMVIGSSVVVALFAIGWVPRLISRHNQPAASDGAGQAVAVKPNFKTVTPAAGTAVTPKFDSERKVVSYGDTIAGTPVVVSEQPIPAGFKADAASSLTNLAKQINANDKLPSETLAFAGLSAKGPQTVLFVKNDLLMFIVADKKIDSKSWASYIDKLH